MNGERATPKMASELIQRRPWRAFVPYFVLSLGLLTTLASCYYVVKTSEAREKARFSTAVQELATFIQDRPRLYIELLRAGSGLFATRQSIAPQEFHTFVERLELEQYPGAEGMGFVARVKEEEKQTFAAERQRQDSTFHVFPNQTAAEYMPVVFYERLQKRENRPIGYDLSTEPALQAAMEQARDSGLPAASARVSMVSPNNRLEQARFVIFSPVYLNDRIPETVSDRREFLSGFMYCDFVIGDLITTVISNRKITDIDLRVYDGVAPASENPLHDTVDAPRTEPPIPGRRLQTQTTINVGGRTWTLTFASRPEFNSSSSRSLYYTAAVGLLITLLLFFLSRSQARAQAVAEQTARELENSEATVRTTLEERERAEAALRESEERYRELVENANDLVFTLDFDGRFTSTNKACELLTEYSRNELLAMKITEILTPASAEVGRRMFDHKPSGQQRTNYEVDVKSRSGRILTLEVSNRLVFKHDTPVLIQGIARNITARRRAEEALREADQRALSDYEQLLERMSGLAEALGTARHLLPIFRALRDFARASVPCDGIFVSLYDSVRDERRACYGWGDSQEIDTSELTPMAVSTAGFNSRAVRTGQVIITDDYMNATRGQPSVVVGPENGLRPQSSMALPMAVMGRIVGTIEVQSYERSAYRKGHVTAMSMAANLTAIAIESVALLERESTARAAAEESNRLKDEFLATVSHELRTPLTAILGWSRMLETGMLDAEIASRAIETIRRNAKAQSEIVDDILDVSRIITSNLHLELQPIEVAPVVEAAINVIRPGADAKRIQIECDFNSQPIVVSGDANRLQQVIWNLLSNAVKFTESGGRVCVSLHQIDSKAEIRVTDSGQGISPDFLPFVFDRFRQADSTTTRRHGGLGLGLAIARHIVEIHGGTIYAASGGAARGAIFTITLPLFDPAARVGPRHPLGVLEPGAEEQLSLTGLHVLLVDDDEDNLALMTVALRRKKARVTAVASADEALEVIKDLRPDVLVSDIAMPGKDGYELIHKIRSLTFGAAQIPAVAVTAYAKDEDRVRALASGFQGYLAKPAELSELVSVIARAVGRA